MACCEKIGYLLSLEQDFPIEQVVNSGVVPRLVQFLKKHSNPKLQLEAAWALCPPLTEKQE